MWSVQTVPQTSRPVAPAAVRQRASSVSQREVRSGHLLRVHKPAHSQVSDTLKGLGRAHEELCPVHSTLPAYRRLRNFKS